MPSERPRSPPQMPAGSSSLSERIAALQRKASGGGGGGGNSASLGPGSVGSHGRYGTGGSSSGMPNEFGSMARSVSNSSSSSSSSQQGAVQSTSYGSQAAVRDRIARFQQSASENGAVERPLIPRSSFGAPAPNPDNDRLRVHRPYPGNMLRPQMTGGSVMWDASRRGSGSGAASLKPQLTGPTWTSGGGGGSLTSRRQASTPESSVIGGGGGAVHDAFADLDIATGGGGVGGLGSHAADVASQAAAKRGGVASAKRSSIAGLPAARAPLVSPPIVEDEGSVSLPVLPDTPDREIPRIPVGVHVPSSGGEEDGGDESEAKVSARRRKHDNLPHLPAAPQDEPTSPSPSTNNTSLAADGLPSPPIAHPADESIEIQIAARTPEEMEAIRRRAEEQERRERAAEQQQKESANGQSVGGGDDHSQHQANGAASTTTQSQPSPLDAAREAIAAGKSKSNGNGNGNGVGSAEDGAATAEPTPTPAPAADLASSQPPRPMSSAGPPRRSTIRRPPPGKVMSVAEMDASDDEYEPGWASVVRRT